MLSLGKHQANSLAMPVALGAASRASGVAGGASLSRGEMHNMRGSWKPGVSVESYARDMKRLVKCCWEQGSAQPARPKGLQGRREDAGHPEADEAVGWGPCDTTTFERRATFV